MKATTRFITVITLTALLFSCRETYTPPQITTNSNYLVVEGLINTGTDSTFFKLSRTVRLNAKTTTQNETHAIVTVESDANAVYPLKEITPGTYASAPLGLSSTAKYRLRIITNTNTHTTYLSDFAPVKNSPPIDSIGYTLQPDGLQIYANTHDATNNTRYYRYDFSEAWEFRTYYDSLFIPVLDPVQGPGYLKYRDLVNNNVNICWSNVYATDIVLGSTAKLSQDELYQEPITFVPSTAEKLRIRYSINVKQYALTEDAFNFWQLLKKNTEQLGSIFDAQPSSLIGNIHNIADNSEPVLGYISAGAIQQKRIFINNTTLPTSWVPLNIYLFPCSTDPKSSMTVPIADYATYFYTGQYLPLFPVFDTAGNLIGYAGGIRECTDCTLKGYNKKPSFWKD